MSEDDYSKRTGQELYIFLKKMLHGLLRLANFIKNPFQKYLYAIIAFFTKCWWRKVVKSLLQKN